MKPTTDIGIVTTDQDAMVEFYGAVIGLPTLPDLRLPGFLVKRFQVGDCVLKLLTFDKAPGNAAPVGGLDAATGLRYWTLTVANLAEILAAVEFAGRNIVTGPTRLRSGVTIALVSDPDGNLLELVELPTG